MDKSLVVYATRAGTSKDIAESIANVLQCEAVAVNKCKQKMIYEVKNIIYVGGIRMNIMYKYKRFVSNMNLQSKKLVTVAVGMTYPTLDFIRLVARKNNHDINASEHVFTYLQGAFDLAKVKTRMEKFLLVKLAENIENKFTESGTISDSEKVLLDSVKTPAKYFRNNHLVPVIEIIDIDRAGCIPVNLMIEYDKEGNIVSYDRPCIAPKDCSVMQSDCSGDGVCESVDKCECEEIKDYNCGSEDDKCGCDDSKCGCEDSCDDSKCGCEDSKCSCGDGCSSDDGADYDKCISGCSDEDLISKCANEKPCVCPQKHDNIDVK